MIKKVLLILSALYIFFAFSCKADNDKSKIIIDKLLVFDTLESGDIILRKGLGFISDLITKTLNDTVNISHCGLIYKKNNDLYVIHSISGKLSPSNGIQIEKLSSFNENSVKNSTIIVRPKNIEYTQEKIVNNALYLLDSNATFDDHFVLGGSALYCSELIWAIFPEKVKDEIFILKTPKNIISFDSFLNTDFFTVIIDQTKDI